MKLSDIVGETVMVTTLYTGRYSFMCHGILKLGVEDTFRVKSDNRDVSFGTFEISFSPETVTDILSIDYGKEGKSNIIYSIVLE